MPKSPKLNSRQQQSKKKFKRNLLLIPMSVFIVKVFIILGIQGFDWFQAGSGNLSNGLKILLDNNYIPPNAWYGADGENYIQGLHGLAMSGFFSDEGKLTYWPAGYPLLMWPVLELFGKYFFAAISIMQSLFYFLGSFWFAYELSKTRLANASYLFVIFLSFNPTLSLNTISIGYELPVVTMSLIATASFLHYFNGKNNSLFRWEIFVASFAFAISAFMQPRLIALAVVFFVIWALASFRLRVIPLFLCTTMAVVSIAPAIMIYRNQQVHGYTAISTNLGITMKLGAGSGTSGGYSNKPSGIVQCPSTNGNAAQQDTALVRCVIGWYLENPATALKLFWNKARFFWSPWFGPEANGTMARNPWSKIHPFNSTIQSESGSNLVFGGFGRFISWLWMLFTLALLILGFKYMWSFGGLERALALLAISAFFMNLVSSMLTIGDHRFRIPSMGMSLLLQTIGLMSFVRSRRGNISNSTSLVMWPSLSHRDGKRNSQAG